VEEIKCNLKEIRLKEYLIDSKKEFASMLEVEEHRYGSWEREESFPNLKTALQIANKLNKKLEEVWHL
jgi:DNA-binding XRE family transcriptional regulator